jgi:hypothetical protein
MLRKVSAGPVPICPRDDGIMSKTMPKTAREPALKPTLKPPPAIPPKSTFEGVQHTFKVTKAPPPDCPYDGPMGDLLAAEAVLDLLRLAVEKDFAGDFVECRQESAAVAAGHALRLVHRARLAYAEALAAAVSTRAAVAVPKAKRAARQG